jgi:hypothetical protein
MITQPTILGDKPSDGPRVVEDAAEFFVPVESHRLLREDDATVETS